MWVVFLLLLSLLFSVAPALAEPGFSKKYERDYNMFNPASRYAPENSLNFAQAYVPDDPFNSVNRKSESNRRTRQSVAKLAEFC